MTLKAILGIVMLVLVVGGLIAMKLKNRKQVAEGGIFKKLPPSQIR